MTHPCVWHDPFTCVTWPNHMCEMTHSYVWHDRFTCVTWLIHMSDSFWHHYPTRNPLLLQCSSAWHDAFTCVTRRIYTRDMTHSCVWNDSFTCVKWNAWHIRDVTYSYMTYMRLDTSLPHWPTWHPPLPPFLHACQLWYAVCGVAAEKEPNHPTTAAICLFWNFNF